MTDWPSICGKCGAVYNDADDGNLIHKKQDGITYCYCGHCHKETENLLDKLTNRKQKTLIGKFEHLE